MNELLNMMMLNDGTADGQQSSGDQQTTTQQAPQKTKTELLREISEEFGFNAFKPEEVKAQLEELKAIKDSQKSEQDKLQEQVEALTKEKGDWATEKAKLESKLIATTLGITEDKLEDALILAGNDPNKLKDVVEKYPMFTQGKNIVIGVNNQNNNSNPSVSTEQELYMKNNPKLYGKYTK